MKLKIVLLALTLFMTSSTMYHEDIPSGDYSIMAEIGGGFSIGHYRYKGKLLKLDSSQNAIDSTFEIVPGLVDQPGTVSFRALTPKFGNYYLIHKEFRIVLAKKENNQNFKEHATFWVESPNYKPKAKARPTNRPGEVGRVSFRAYNFPSHFIRHEDFKLYIAAGTGSQFKKDTSFVVMGPNANYWQSLQR